LLYGQTSLAFLDAKEVRAEAYRRRSCTHCRHAGKCHDR
jgi:hypothetical protein